MEKETKLNKKTTSTKSTTTKKTTNGERKTSSKKPAQKQSSKSTGTNNIKKNDTSKKTTTKTTSTTKSINKKNSSSKQNVVSKDIKKDEVEFSETGTKKVKNTKLDSNSKNKNEDKETTLGQDFKNFVKSDIGSLIGIVLIIIIVMGGFFFITDFIKKNSKNEQELIMINDIQYDEILISNILKQPNDAYYVLIYDKGNETYDSNDMYLETFELYLSNYKNSENSLRVYKADLSKKFNESYISNDNSNLLVSDVKDFKVNSTTLIKVENDKVVSAYETPDSIIEHLVSLVENK